MFAWTRSEAGRGAAGPAPVCTHSGAPPPFCRAEQRSIAGSPSSHLRLQEPQQRPGGKRSRSASTLPSEQQRFSPSPPLPPAFPQRKHREGAQRSPKPQGSVGPKGGRGAAQRRSPAAAGSAALRAVPTSKQAAEAPSGAQPRAGRSGFATWAVNAGRVPAAQLLPLT